MGRGGKASWKGCIKMNERKEGSGVWEEGARRHGKGALK